MLTSALTLFFSVNWGAVLSFLSILVLVASTLRLLIADVQKLPPAQKNLWLQRAVEVAVKGVADDTNLEAVLTAANAYLKLHGIPVSITEAELHLVLAEAQLVLSGKVPTLPA